MAKAALAAGKHVQCETPLGRTARKAAEMALAAEAAGRVTMVEFNSIKNPATQPVRENMLPTSSARSSISAAPTSRTS
jgi:predicted dehydrogenase